MTQPPGRGRNDLVALKSGAPIKRMVAPLARRFSQICIAAIAEMAAVADLTPLQYGVLAYLFEEPDIDQNGLAARLGIDRTSTGQLVDQLEAKGLVDRRVNREDRRARLLRLTPAGERLREHLRPKALTAQARVLAPLSAAEKEVLFDLLVRLIEANESLARPGAGRRKRAAPVSNPSKSRSVSAPRSMPPRRSSPAPRRVPVVGAGSGKSKQGRR